VLWLLSRRFLSGAHSESMRQVLGLRAPRLAWWVIASVAASIVVNIAMMGGDSTVDATSAGNHWLTEIAAGSPVGSALGLLVVFLVTPMAHEFVFRGLLQTSLIARWGRPLAIFSVALLFTVLHPVFRTHDVAGIAAVAIAAVALGLIRDASGSIFPGVLASSLVAWLWVGETIIYLG
jgi:membrane protease YdiL (CAAX protease family)